MFIYFFFIKIPKAFSLFSERYLKGDDRELKFLTLLSRVGARLGIITIVRNVVIRLETREREKIVFKRSKGSGCEQSDLFLDDKYTRLSTFALARAAAFYFSTSARC